MAPKHYDVPCFVPPHPDLFARSKVEILQAQREVDDAEPSVASKILHGERRIPGQNDGTIFPKSHYHQPTSIMKMSNAALERTPLRNNIKYALKSEVSFVFSKSK